MIFGSSVDLYPISLDDTSLIVKWRNSPQVKENFIFRDDITPENHIEYYRKYIETGKIEQFMIVEKATSSSIGCVYLRDIDYQNSRAEFGIFIGEDSCRGKGYGRESTLLLCSYGFETLNLHKIMLRVFPFNKSAIRMYESVGFKQEAYLKDDIKVNGKYEDIIFMSLLCNGKHPK